MAGDYVAFAWADASDALAVARSMSLALAASGAWSRAQTGGGLEVWTRGPTPPPVSWLASGRLAVIGRMRWRGDLGARCAGAPDTAIAVAGGLIADAWGAYVALLRDWDTPVRWILRDPSGALDALTWRRGGVAVVASDIENLPLAVLPQHLALDWDVLAEGMQNPGAVMAHSALHGLDTVTPGDLRRLGGGPAVALWRPRDWLDRPAPTPAEAERRLRDAVDLAVAAAVPRAGRYMVEVSGGLDSAIVAGTAARRTGGGEIAGALHLLGDRPEADERRWAERVIAELGWPLETIPLREDDLTEGDLMVLAKGARPVINAPDVHRDQAAAEVLQRLGADTLITGKGGDAVFFQHPTAEILSDYLAIRGWRGLADPVTVDLARRLRRSVWSLAWEAVRGPGRPTPPSPLLGARAGARRGSLAHPWLEGIEALPPAKRRQVRGLVTTQAMRGLTRYRRVAEVVHPLMAQPVLEAALSIPTWELGRGGRERGLARDAFADRIPAAIRDRTSKGELGGFMARIVLRNLGLLRPWLLDGTLCGAEVLSRHALEAALTPEALIRDADAAFLLRAAAVEGFARYWQGRLPPARDVGRPAPDGSARKG